MKTKLKLPRAQSLWLCAVVFAAVICFAVSCSGGGGGGPGGRTPDSSSGGGTYTVTFNSMGGTSVSPINVKPGSAIAAPASPAREPAGYYSFGAWYKDAGLSNVWNFSTDKVTDNITLYAKWTPTKSVGDSGQGGGIIFYVDPDGFEMTDTGESAYYLEAAEEDAGSDFGKAMWMGYTSYGEYLDSVNTAEDTTEEAIGSGRKNTALIVARFSTFGVVPFYEEIYDDDGKCAALDCTRYSKNGKTDWFLPSKGELNELYISKSTVGNLEEDYYWSSTETDGSSASMQDLTDGVVSDMSKPSPNWVRPIRAF